MRINSINSSYMPSRNMANYNNKPNNNQPNVQFEGKKDSSQQDKTLLNAARMTTGALAASLILGAGGGLAGCDKFDEEHNYTIKVPVDTVEKYIPIIMDPDTTYIIKHDTIQLPGKDSIIIKHDTIDRIITKIDTLFMKEEYDSPVAPVIKKFYETLKINPGNGRIPVKMIWTDEKDGSLNKSIFDGKSSSINQMTFNITKTPFDDDQGGVVIGKNEQFYRLKFSKVNDRSLALTFEKPRINGKPEEGRDDQWRADEYFIYDIKTNNVKRYTLKDDNSLEDRGEFMQGDMPSSIILNNQYGSKYRYSSLSVKSTDAPSKTEDYEK